MTRIIRIFILLFSLAYVAMILTTFTADRLSSLAMYKGEKGGEYDVAILLIDKAILLDPTNDDLYFRKYKIISDLLKEMREKGASLSVILSEADLSAEARAKEEGRVEESKSSSPSPLASSLTPSLRLSAEALAKAEAKGDEAISPISVITSKTRNYLRINNLSLQIVDCKL